MNELRLMERRLAGRYRCDARGRLLMEAAPGCAEVPRFYFVRTRLGNLWRLRADVPGDTAERLATLAAREPPLGLPPAPPERLEFIRQALERDAPIEAEEVSPVFGFPSGGARRGVGDRVVRPLRPEDVAALDPDLAACGVDGESLQRPDGFAVWRNGRVLAVAHTRFDAESEVAEVWVVSAPASRRRGYARALVEVWGQHVRESGRTPLLSGSRVSGALQPDAHGFEVLGEDRRWL